MSLDPFERVGKDAAIRPPSLTWFASWKLRPKKSLENTSEGSSDSARLCHILHGMLVMIHIVLVIFHIHHWEHRVTLSFTPTNNNVWPAILSASLQAFYTIYTAVLLFLTQRLAISRTLVRRLKLTAIHDIIGAWAGLGSALGSVWRQTNIPASWWMTFAVTAYLASISVLHVTSSTLLQFQTFNTSMATSVPTTLGWLNDISYGSDTNWEFMTASLPVVNRLPGLVTAGISNTTLYDTIQTSSVEGNATVNATTITSRCGLLPNVTSNDGLLLIDPFNIPGIGTTSASSRKFLASDAIPVPGIFLTVSALLEIKPSVQEKFRVNIPWGKSPVNMDYVFPAYVVLCSLSANPTHGVVDMQNNGLLSPVPIWQPSTQWEEYQWTKNDTWEAEMGRALSSPVGSGYAFRALNNINVVEPSMMDEYIMSLVGLNLSAAYSQWDTSSSNGGPNATVVVRLDKLELAVAKVVAQLIWLAGQLGASNEGLQPGNGMAYVNEDLIALRLNINLLPLSVAAFASVIMLGLTLYMTRASDALHDRAAIPGIGALQLLWLGHHSASISEVMEAVKEPTEVSLREAGTIDICFAKMISDEEGRLAGEVDHGRDDELGVGVGDVSIYYK
ncbi:hypothetical protein DFH29DRAFT_1083930 [Suillus ampliporus]|nr:hypothetical protein DFH29DRAFT_1083930 [Suillus ampliporus]